MTESTKRELKDAGDKKRVKRRRNYDDHDKEVAAEDSKVKSSGQNGGKNDSESESEDDEKLDMLLNKEDEDEDDLAEIDSSNIITGGRRTRGKMIDYKKTAEVLDKEAGKSAEDASGKEEAAAAEGGDEDADEDAEDVDFKEPEQSNAS
ncbi:LADA_0G15170g1_1 [Lachancea dasiensis]|uniref:Histone H2A.Z-specific chaperone CHZ1 n=1 Tax=Lachancea dasiensis TaxID=1072105 RepID=A0A1G4JWC3_9SACH|nr:LADA_0G15170g1_1 [Lachancea dasiensis]